MLCIKRKGLKTSILAFSKNFDCRAFERLTRASKMSPYIYARKEGCIRGYIKSDIKVYQNSYIKRYWQTLIYVIWCAHRDWTAATHKGRKKKIWKIFQKPLDKVNRLWYNSLAEWESESISQCVEMWAISSNRPTTLTTEYNPVKYAIVLTCPQW